MSSQSKRRLYSKKQRGHEERLAYIHQAIASGRYPTVRDLMVETGYRRHAILEDIRYLRLFKGFPIKVSRKEGRRGYYYDGPVPEKLANTFNEQGVMNLALAQCAVATIPVKGKSRLGIDMKTISQILVPHTKILLDEVQQTVFFRPFAPEEVDVDIFVTLSKAARKRRELEFMYLKNMAQLPERKRVRPYQFLVAANCWYMIGLDVDKQKVRTYLLSRLSAPVMTEVGFKNPKFDLHEYLKGCFIVMKGDESHDIVLEFSPWARTYIENRHFVHGQKMEVLPNGGLRVSFWLSCLEEVEYWIRWWGPNVKVMESDGLKERLRNYRGYLEYLG